MQYTLSESDRIYTGEHYSGDIGARAIHPDGTAYRTFRTQTVLVDGDRVRFENCTFENTAGSGKVAGQAIALYLDGDDIHLENCILKGHQDTLFLAPLPPKEVEPGGFTGPKQLTPRKDHTVYFKNCRIEGGVDFIFGGATAYFEDCEFVSNEAGYVFAPSTPEHVEVGFVAKNCRFLRAEGIPDGSCYIARPWRIYAKLRLEDCWMDAHICPAGYHDWNKPEAHGTTVFEEYRSKGPGAEQADRPDWVRFESGGEEITKTS
ncbi:MAG: pectin methylesterase [Lachnospiraceae bacterium]|nr:pectin methylesterase [Lachnospiraceae bacterium]